MTAWSRSFSEAASMHGVGCGSCAPRLPAQASVALSHPLLSARIMVYEALPTIEHARHDAAAGRRCCHVARLGGGNQRKADGGDHRE